LIPGSSQLNLTSCGVTGSLFWNLIPFRSVKVALFESRGDGALLGQSEMVVEHGALILGAL
jgi:hypothetical protein